MANDKGPVPVKSYGHHKLSFFSFFFLLQKISGSTIRYRSHGSWKTDYAHRVEGSHVTQGWGDEWIVAVNR